jgi:hypothetical protein
LLAAAGRLLPPERWSCFAISAQTLRRWHRALLQGNGRQRPRRLGRPPLAAETRSLIKRLARENPEWGYMRIQGELKGLGIGVSATTIATVLRNAGLGPAPRRIGPSWSEFLRAQAHNLVACDLRLADAVDGIAAEPSPEGFQNSVQAAARYSWMRPPSRSWRSIFAVASRVAVCPASDGRSASARRPRRVVMSGVSAKHVLELTTADDQQPVEALGARHGSTPCYAHLNSLCV